MKKNEISKSKKIAILMAIAMMIVLFCGSVFAQNEERLPAGFYPKGSTEYIKYFGDSSSVFKAETTHAAEITTGGVGYPWTNLIYQGNSLYYVPEIYFSGNTMVNAYDASLMLTVNSPVNVVYSLYTYKSTFPQDNKRYAPESITSPSMQAIQECGTYIPLSTQADIDNDLDKIYEFHNPDSKDGSYNETVSGVRRIYWDGKTDAAITGKPSLPVRDCLFVAMHDKNTGNLLGITGSIPLEGYKIRTSPGVEYTAGPTSVSAKITVAYEKPVRRIWAILAKSGCTTGSEFVTFNVVNQGGPAIAAGMNKKEPGVALAVTELKNPVLDNDGLVKIFNWNDITGLDGKPVLPPDQNTKYMLLLDTEGDDGHGNVIPTFTGLNDGFLVAGGDLITFPMPTNYTGIQNPVSDDEGIVIETTPEGFIINSKSNYDSEWELTSTAGAKVSTGKGSFVSKSGLPKGVYLLTVTNKQGGKKTQKVVVGMD